MNCRIRQNKSRNKTEMADQEAGVPVSNPPPTSVPAQVQASQATQV